APRGAGAAASVQGKGTTSALRGRQSRKVLPVLAVAWTAESGPACTSARYSANGTFRPSALSTSQGAAFPYLLWPAISRIALSSSSCCAVSGAGGMVAGSVVGSGVAGIGGGGGAVDRRRSRR